MPAQMEHFLENVTLHVQIKEASLSIFTNAHLTQDLTKTQHRMLQTNGRPRQVLSFSEKTTHIVLSRVFTLSVQNHYLLNRPIIF